MVGVAEENPIAIEDRLALALVSALQAVNPTALIEIIDGEGENQRTLIDGSFNLRAVAMLILYNLDLPPRSELRSELEERRDTSSV
jgi:hypothetical protein